MKINLITIIVLALILSSTPLVYGEEEFAVDLNLDENATISDDVTVYTNFEEVERHAINVSFSNVSEEKYQEWIIKVEPNTSSILDNDFENIVFIEIGQPVTYDFYSWYGCRFGYGGFKFII